MFSVWPSEMKFAGESNVILKLKVLSVFIWIAEEMLQVSEL